MLRHDNYIGLGCLYSIIGDNFKWDDRYKIVKDLTKNKVLDELFLRDVLPEEIADHILLNVKPLKNATVKDIPRWMLEVKGNSQFNLFGST